MNRLDTKDYEKSNKIEKVALNKFSTKLFKDMLNSDDTKANRQKNAQALCDYLNERFKMPKCKVIVTDKAQPCTRNARVKVKELGNYTPLLMTITLFNKTAVKKQTVAIKTLADVLLHEFIHHYDMTYLKFDHSPPHKRFLQANKRLEKQDCRITIKNTTKCNEIIFVSLFFLCIYFQCKLTSY